MYLLRTLLTMNHRHSHQSSVSNLCYDMTSSCSTCQLINTAARPTTRDVGLVHENSHNLGLMETVNVHMHATMSPAAVLIMARGTWKACSESSQYPGSRGEEQSYFFFSLFFFFLVFQLLSLRFPCIKLKHAAPRATGIISSEQFTFL